VSKFAKKSTKDNGLRPVRPKEMVSHEGGRMEGCGQTEQREFGFDY
jgi:hypothetical protein